MKRESSGRLGPQTVARHEFCRQVELPVSAAEAYQWHLRDGALERLIPPWENVRVASRTGGIEDGGEVDLRLALGPLSLSWRARHGSFQPGVYFSDRQLSGPFRSWHHLHRFHPDAADPRRCTLEDLVQYDLPGGWLGRALGTSLVRGKLEAMFEFRHRRTVADLAAHARFAEQAPMKIVVSGSSGLVGGELLPFLSTGGHEVVRLVRRPPTAEDQRQWDPSAGELDPSHLEGCDAVIHLGGESIAEGRWTTAKKERLRSTRVEPTRLLAETLSRLQNPPKTLIVASAIGYYGDQGDQELTEDASPGDDFLAGVCQEWEDASRPAEDAGIRVVRTRFGIILTPRGGALTKLLTPFKLGGGGRVGSGRQYWSWVALDDVVGALHFALMNDALRGPVNVVAPHPLTNADFTRVLGKVLRRPTLLPMPAFAMRTLLGEMADALLLTSARVVPQKLLDHGYQFQFTELEDALRHLLGRPAPVS